MVPDPRSMTAAGHLSTYLIRFTKVQYPAEAAAQAIAGDVMLKMVVGRDGTVLEVAASEGHPLLAEAATSAVRTWNYRPTKLNGVAVEVAPEIRVRFELPDLVLFD
jgi:periplasmic protein TonB